MDVSRKLFILHITAPYNRNMNIYHDMMSHTLLTCESHANHNKEASKRVIIMNFTRLICTLAGRYMFEGSFNNSGSTETITKQSLIFSKLFYIIS